MASVGYLTTAVIAASAVTLYQVFVTVRLIRFAGYSPLQKTAQVFLIWFVPLIGALVVHLVIRGTEKSVTAADRNFTPQDPQSVG